MLSAFETLDVWTLLVHVLSRGRIRCALQDARHDVDISLDACQQHLQHGPRVWSVHVLLPLCQSAVEGTAPVELRSGANLFRCRIVLTRMTMQAVLLGNERYDKQYMRTEPAVTASVIRY